MKKPVSTISALLALTAPLPAMADVNCDFTVAGLGITGDGWGQIWVTAPGLSKGWWVCPLSGSTVVNDGYSSSRTIASDSCKGIYSQLLTAKASAKQIRFTFHGPADCSSASLPDEGVPSLFPSMIQLVQ